MQLDVGGCGQGLVIGPDGILSPENPDHWSGSSSATTGSLPTPSAAIRSNARETRVEAVTVAGRGVIASPTSACCPALADRAISEMVMIPTSRPSSTTGAPWDWASWSLFSNSLRVCRLGAADHCRTAS